MLWSGFILGLLGSFHCLGMCGPIAFLLPVDRENVGKRFFQIFLYHIGRIFTYSVIGLLFGLLGRGLYLFGFQQKLSIITGALMILLVVLTATSIKINPGSKLIYGTVGKLKNKLGSALKKKSSDTFITIGFLNGFLPCGLVYMAVLGALASGDLWQGGLYMVLFGAGTIPLMTSAVYFGNILKGKIRQRIRKAIPIFVILVGALFILRGLGLGIPYVSPKPAVQQVTSKLKCQAMMTIEGEKSIKNLNL